MNNTVRFIARALRLMLTLVGAATVLVYGSASIIRSLNRRGDHPSIHVYPSPDGHMVAAAIRREGGDYLAPYCSDVVAILPASDSPDHILNDAYEVYTGACSQRGPAVEWKTSHAVQIDFQIAWDADGSTNEYSLKNRDRSKSAKVSFAGREP